MLLKITLLIFKLSSYLSIGGGSSAPPDVVFIILQIIKNKANHHPTRHHAENCINTVFWVCMVCSYLSSTLIHLSVACGLQEI